MEEILAFLNQIFPLSPACIEYLRDVVQFRRVEKNELILDFGEVNRNLYFIKTGFLRCYYMVYKKEVNLFLGASLLLIHHIIAPEEARS